MSRFRSIVFYVLLLIMSLAIANFFSSTVQEPEEITRSQFKTWIEQEKVREVKIVNQTVAGTLNDGTEFTTIIEGSPMICWRFLRRRMLRLNLVNRRSRRGGPPY